MRHLTSFPQASSSALLRRMQTATCPRGLQKPSISAHHCQPEKKRRQRHFLGQPVCSNCTGHCSAHIIALNHTWPGDLILNQVKVHLCYLLRQPAQHHCCSGK